MRPSFNKLNVTYILLMDSHSGEYILLLNKARIVKLLQTDYITMASFW